MIPGEALLSVAVRVGTNLPWRCTALFPSTSTEPHPPRGADHTCRFSWQIKNPKTRMKSSGGLEELGVLPEEEAAGGDEDREKEILIERIQSIKEEKQVSLRPHATLPTPIHWPLHYRGSSC